ncbi:efflux transporter outer membrane subunit [Lutibacter maritimus]|uniref:Efflux transporter, outer membrane factor (OMF) lipoprotein, NodT family n=1 Tax=Lutibacter maritimus TaxID=593133 RepID=A0A1I6P3U9_9FLAO|nr:efflux transporter outer membrane subunit [Lutibacter maritimus]SFS34845.1 efflux transporter, outer membrane factor (OMF) lipoprotein, NodT family [Lutibacter maritimus]
MKTQKIYKILLIIGLPILLSSCFAAKEYSRPETIISENSFRTDAISKDSLSMAVVSWKELFTDQFLQKYINEGLINNIDNRVALQQIIAAQAYLKQGKAGYLPTLNGSLQFNHQENSDNMGYAISSANQYSLGANLSWEADIWGKIRSNKRAFEASYLQSVAAHQAIKTTLVSQIAAVYYQLLSLDEQVKITKETIETREKGLTTTQALKESGYVTEIAVKQTEAQLYTAKSILIDLNEQIHLLENTMSILLGKSSSKIERSTFSEQKIAIPLEIGVPALLLSNRPDVIAAESRFMQAFELTNVARSNFYPTITLTASGGFQSLDFDNFFNASSLFSNVLGGLTQPIFNSKKIKTQYEVSKAQQEQALLRFKETLLNASKEVSDAMYSYKAATEKIAIKEKEFNAYNTASSYSQELLNNGLANYLEVLNAQENALNSQLGLINAQFNQLKYTIDLYKALGGGWR